MVAQGLSEIKLSFVSASPSVGAQFEAVGETEFVASGRIEYNL
jgi:hypothetical protein